MEKLIYIIYYFYYKTDLDIKLVVAFSDVIDLLFCFQTLVSFSTQKSLTEEKAMSPGEGPCNTCKYTW